MNQKENRSSKIIRLILPKSVTFLMIRLRFTLKIMNIRPKRKLVLTLLELRRDTV